MPVKYSAYPAKDLSKMSMQEIKNVIGVESTVSIPPRCKYCGNYLYLDKKIGAAQCFDCGRPQRIYINSTESLITGWE